MEVFNFQTATLYQRKIKLAILKNKKVATPISKRSGGLGRSPEKFNPCNF